MQDIGLCRRLEALERYVEDDARRWHVVHERIDALRGVVLGIAFAVRSTEPEIFERIIDALRRFESGARRTRTFEAAVLDMQELIEVMEACRH